LGTINPEFTGIDCPNVNGMIAAIIDEKKATLHELRTIYSLEDAYQIWEVIAVRRYNEYKAQKFYDKKAKRAT